MTRELFNGIDTWVFDLDHTLYPPHMRLFDQIEEKMIAFMIREIGVTREEADKLRQEYWSKYGTTLAGLMELHNVDPRPYLVEVHDISFAPLRPDPALAIQIRTLPGRKLIYTNGSAPYARKVVEARGLSGLFDGVFGVEHAAFRPKPERQAFETVFALADVSPASSVMFEDDIRNLLEPHRMGMRTVHVAPEAMNYPHIHHHTNDLAAFLSELQP